jgi:hypothetical protein
MSGYESRCRRGCCWTPQDVCARHGQCACHRSKELTSDMEIAAFLGISLDEVARRRVLRTKTGEPIEKRWWRTQPTGHTGTDWPVEE